MAVKGDALADRMEDLYDYFRAQGPSGLLVADLVVMWGGHMRGSDVTEKMWFAEVDELIKQLKVAKSKIKNW